MKKLIFIIISSFFYCTISYCQNEEPPPKIRKNQKRLERSIKYAEEKTYVWGLVGMPKCFVVDETEITVGEWIEFLHYYHYLKMPSYFYKRKMDESDLSKKEKWILLNLPIDTTLLPDRNILESMNKYFVFSPRKPKLVRYGGLHGWVFLPMEKDSLKKRKSRKDLLYYLNTPVTGLSYEQAMRFCKWRTEVDSFTVRKYYLNHYSCSYLDDQIFEECFMPCYRYTLPSPEQFDSINLNLDSISINKKYASAFNYKNSSYSKKKRFSYTNRRCGRTTIQVFTYNVLKTKFYKVKSTQGNVAEMTSVEGVARGGSYYHYAKESSKGISNYYSKPEPWLGFRCVGIKRPVYDYKTGAVIFK
ncbi:MAG: SUMF1/EgtB/PvdO family nonheme iron enzyme [Bacteroidota bacterium]